MAKFPKLFSRRARPAPESETRALAADYADQSFIMHEGRLQPIRAIIGSDQDVLSGRFYRGLAVEFGYDDQTLAEAYAAGMTAWICANRRATMLSSLPLRIETRDGEVVDQHPFQAVIDRGRKFMWLIEIAQMIWGKSYLYKLRNRWRYPSDLQNLNPLDVTPNLDSYMRRVMSYRLMQKADLIPAQDMVAILRYNPLTDFDAISPFEVSMMQLGMERNLIMWSAAFFLNSARPDGILNFEGTITPDEKQSAKEEWQAFKGARNAWRTFVGGTQSGGKWTWTAVSPPPAELAMAEQTENVRTGICACFEMNPVLVGFGRASDPLSAQNTYEQISVKTMQDVIIPEGLMLTETISEQWVHADFGAYGQGLKLTVDTSQVTAAALSTPERSLAAQGNVVNGIWSVNDARKHLGSPEEEPGALQRNPAWASLAYNDGAIRHGEYRQSIGYKPDPLLALKYKDEVSPPSSPFGLPFGNSLPPKPSVSAGGPSGGFQGPSSPRPIAPLNPQVPLIPAAVGRGAPSCYSSLSLANDPDLIALQESARLIMGDEGVSWSTPASFHVTLCHAPIRSPEALAAVESAMPTVIDELDVPLRDLSTFEGDETDQPLIIRVELTEELRALQRAMVEVMTRAGLECSEYSDPERWQPHITLGYVTKGTPIPDVTTGRTLHSRDLQLSRDDYTLLHTTRTITGAGAIDIRADDLTLSARLSELKVWREKVKKRGPDTPFKVKYLSLEHAEVIRSGLDEGWSYSLVFDAVKAWLQGGPRPGPFGAAPEDYEDFWGDFDRLDRDLGRAFLDHQARLGAALFTDIVERPDLVDLDSPMRRSAERLAADWIGTEEAPGPLTALFLAGMAAGDRAIRTGEKSNPRALQMAVDWSLAPKEAVNFARRYGYDLIRRIDEQTRQGIGETLVRALEEGWSRKDLQEGIGQWLIQEGSTPSDKVKRRAMLIGDTESTRAYNNGAFERWSQAGVTRAVWQTVRDDRVCPICRELHGQEASISEGWLSQRTGERYRDMAHIGCRCFRAPIVPALSTVDLPPESIKVKPGIQPPSVPPPPVGPAIEVYPPGVNFTRTKKGNFTGTLFFSTSDNGAYIINDHGLKAAMPDNWEDRYLRYELKAGTTVPDALEHGPGGESSKDRRDSVIVMDARDLRLGDPKTVQAIVEKKTAAYYRERDKLDKQLDKGQIDQAAHGNRTAELEKQYRQAVSEDLVGRGIDAYMTEDNAIRVVNPVKVQLKQVYVKDQPLKYDPAAASREQVLARHTFEVEDTRARLTEVKGQHKQKLAAAEQERVNALARYSEAWNKVTELSGKAFTKRMIVHTKGPANTTPDPTMENMLKEYGKLEDIPPDHRALAEAFDQAVAEKREASRRADAALQTRVALRTAYETAYRQAFKQGLGNTSASQFGVTPDSTFGKRKAKVLEDKVQKGIDWLNEVMNGQRYGQNPYTKFQTTPKQRSFHLDSLGVYMNTDAPISTVVHEMGHEIEYRNPAVHREAVKFLRDRANFTEIPKHLGTGYERDEMAIYDKFKNAYIGKVYGDWQTGQLRATEIVSMGLEELFRDPVQFAEDDPEYFDFMIGILKGWYE